MIDPNVRKIIKDIKSLKIQGARNVAKASVRAIIIQVKNSKAKSLESLHSELLVASDGLSNSRPTEPMMRNSLQDVIRFTLMQIKSQPAASVAELKKLIVGHESAYLEAMEKDAQNLAEYGARLIQEGALIITHCHSSTVTSILKRAHRTGKYFEVVACETRPRYQGRITAKELAAAGIHVSLVVDGAMNMFMKKADMCLVGADAITSRGDLINKIGTSTLAHIAKMHDTSFYSAAELYKFNPLTIYGNLEVIEERDAKEVWEKAPKKVKVKNPAFDVTSSKYIQAFITEAGVIPPQSMFSVAKNKLGLKL